MAGACLGPSGDFPGLALGEARRFRDHRCMDRPTIVLTNDDGIRSPGLRAAAEALVDLGDLWVVAPLEQQTAAGRSFRGRREATFEAVPFEVGGQAIRAYACAGSPASVVRHALAVLFGDRRPDLVVSGINYGENVGSSITASGTVGAAYEAASAGLRALAASKATHPDAFLTHGDEDWSAAIHFVRRFAEALLRAELPPDVDVLKLDIPEGATPETPWKVTRQSRQRYFVRRITGGDLRTPLGAGSIVVEVDEATLEADSDVRALRDGWVSVTPLSLDATSRTDFEALARTLGS